MPLLYNQDQLMIRDMIQSYLAENGSVSLLRQMRDANDRTGFSRDLWSRLAELGVNGVCIGQEYGGADLGHVEAGTVLEAIGRNLTQSPYLMTAVGAAVALRYAVQTERERLLPKIAAGECVAALALDERSRHDPAHIGLTAERDGSGFRLTGSKRFVVHGHVSDFVIVSARTSGNIGDEHGITLFVVETGSYSCEPARLVDSSFASRLSFDGALVSPQSVIGVVDQGYPVLAQILDAVRIGAAAELVGVGSASLDITLAYLRQRTQFGRRIGSFQALQHRAAHLYTELEAARATVLRAQKLLDASAPGSAQAVMVAKCQAGLASTLAVQESLQMHGGIGMTDEHDIGLYMKRNRVLNELCGDPDYHVTQFARAAGY